MKAAGTVAQRHRGTADHALLCATVPLCLCASLLAAQTDDAAQRIAREVTPQVERATGLRFKRPPVIAVRSRDQVRQYLDRKMAHDMPPAELAAYQRTYRAFLVISDTLDLRRLMLDLFSEQVAGFYDPDSSELFVVRGADPQMLRLIMAHELVHALQDQYMPLKRILDLRRQNDRQMAAQAVTEGQATLASIMALAPGMDLPDLSAVWGQVRTAIRDQQSAMPVFASAPLLLQESVLFPYLAGAEFMRSFDERRQRPDEQPYGDQLPVSTEQILHASKYTSRERPLRLGFPAPSGDTLVYDDDYGEFETRSLLMTWGVAEDVAVAAAAGWNGDRYEVLGTPGGTAIVWAVAWDTPQDAQDFERALRSGWTRAASARPGEAQRRWQIDTMDLAGAKVVRLVDAPSGWAGWRRLPAPRVVR